MEQRCVDFSLTHALYNESASERMSGLAEILESTERFANSALISVQCEKINVNPVQIITSDFSTSTVSRLT